MNGVYLYLLVKASKKLGADYTKEKFTEQFNGIENTLLFFEISLKAIRKVL
jgi:hypothetical protein